MTLSDAANTVSPAGSNEPENENEDTTKQPVLSENPISPTSPVTPTTPVNSNIPSPSSSVTPIVKPIILSDTVNNSIQIDSSDNDMLPLNNLQKEGEGKV